MSERVLNKLNNFSGYTSIHGIGRIGDVKYWFLKIFWTLAFMASFGMCVWQIYRLGILFISQPVNTLVKTESNIMDFPGITVCNLNPLRYSKVKLVPYLFQVIDETADAWSIDLSQFEDDGIYENKNFSYAEPYDYYNMDPLLLAKRIFKLRMGNLHNADLINFSQSFIDFMVSRKFLGTELYPDNFTVYRDEEYGVCYKLNLSSQFEKAEIAGPNFGFQLVLNVQQNEYIPFVTESAGIRLAIHDPNSNPLMSEGISLSTGFEINVGVSVVDYVRLPGLSEKCDNNNTYSSIQTCIEQCIGTNIAKTCGCAHKFSYITPKANRMCGNQTDIECMDNVMLNIPNVCSSCKVPCNERQYKTSISMTRWPSGNYEPILQSLISEYGISMTTARSDCLLLRVYYSTLTKETIEEEPAYTEENFVSDIGGQLGLWAGISVLSLIELIELVAHLFVAVCKKSDNDNKVDHLSDYDRDVKEKM